MLQKSSRTSLWLPGAPAPERTTLRNQPRQAFLAMALIAGVVLVLCLYVYQASRITATDHATLQFGRQYARLQRENSNLLVSYASEQSIAKMSQRAVAAGFEPARSIQYVASVTGVPTNDLNSAGVPPTPVTVTQRPQ
jgi:hypothetical protein